MHAHIRLPPDSTGKRIHGRGFLELLYTSAISTFVKGETLTLATSGINMIVSKVEPTSGTAGHLHAILVADSAELEPVAGENIQRNGSTIANINGSSVTKFFDQASVISGREVDSWAIVDPYGALLTSFAEGSPTVDQTSKLRISHGIPIGTYDFASGPQDFLFWDQQVSGGSVTHSTQTSSMLLSVGTTTGAKANRTTNRYHYFQPGTGLIAAISIAHGDAGKTNNERHWGLGDTTNGLFWSLVGTSLNVEIYSDTSGSVLETSINRANWNVDKLDGTGISQFTLDITKRNTFWIDYIWPTGAIRFGVYAADGQRIVAHKHYNVGGDPVVFTRFASMPISVRNENTGTSGSTSELRYFASSVYSDGNLDYVYWRYSDMENTALKTVTTNTPVLNVRSVSGQRVNAYPEKLSVFVTGGAAKIDLYVGIDPAVMTGEVWDIIGSSTLEGDETCSAITLDPTDGSKMVTVYIDPGAHEIDLRGYFETNDIGICTSGDGTIQLAHCFVATALTVSETKVRMTLNYRELS